jgi:hypothetical protein
MLTNRQDDVLRPLPKQLGRLACRADGAERGAIAIMFAGSLFLIFGLLAFSWDLSRMYNRKVELQQIVDAAALAAAHELNGTPAGVSQAVAKAAASVERLKYGYTSYATWSPDAIKFGTALDGDWVDAGTASGNPGGIRYVKVNTNGLGAEHGQVDTIFMRVVSSSHDSVQMGASAIAGPSQMAVVPFAVCAMSSVPAAARVNPGSATPTVAPPNTELVEYGFRRGVSYNLMNLNPNAATPANFLVNPMSGTVDVATAGAFICTGTMAAHGIVGKSVTVTSPFPMGSLFGHFNSRFDSYPAGTCSPNSAPPDANIKAYDRSVAGAVGWMKTVPTSQSAVSLTTGPKLWTIADPLPAPASNKETDYGVLWSYARSVPYSSYVAGQPEPAGGYAPFGTGAWQTLYDPGRPSAPTYPTSSSTVTPYQAISGTNFLAPTTSSHKPGLRDRRVLNVPLLSCPAAGSTANVLAIGRFFMTVPATATTLHAEFAGLASEAGLGVQVELYQ